MTCGYRFVTLPLTIIIILFSGTLKRPPSLPILMQSHSDGDRVTLAVLYHHPPPPPPRPLPPPGIWSPPRLPLQRQLGVRLTSLWKAAKLTQLGQGTVLCRSNPPSNPLCTVRLSVILFYLSVCLSVCLSLSFICLCVCHSLFHLAVSVS